MSEQMRKEFEEWINQDAVFKNPEWLEDVGQYNYTSTQIMWQAWQASRAAIVVDLSDLCEASYTYSGTCYKSDVENRLEQAGVSYK